MTEVVRLALEEDIGPGDVVYFTPYVPHQERNLDAVEAVEVLVVRSDNERIAIALDTTEVDRPETVFCSARFTISAAVSTNSLSCAVTAIVPAMARSWPRLRVAHARFSNASA